MKLLRTEDAVGQMLCHDITQIIPGVKKDAVFRKGHIIREEDIPVLLSVGKANVYIWENDETKMHENDAAEVLRKICQGADMYASEPKEGKIELRAERDGLFVVDTKRLMELNSLGEITIATRNSMYPVKKGDKLCGMRVIPLIIDKEKMHEVEKVAGETPLLELIPFHNKKYGVVNTGSELYRGIIEDKFTPVLESKLHAYGCEMVEHVVCDDDVESITGQIKRMSDNGLDMIFCTGGMSVDPDDRTPLAIKNAGVDIISYGSPVLPGAMFLVSYLPDGRPVCGLPGCVMYEKKTVFDIVLPWLLADMTITPEMLSALGHGGLCLGCDTCHFPNCGFGKGI